MDLRVTLDAIRATYLADSRPWVIGYSGGKDSTCTLQLVWTALASLPREQRQKPVHVLSSNTLVESPSIVAYIRAALRGIETEAMASGMPMSARLVEPLVNDSFWVNLIGRGYPAPNQTFRWCTDRLKISPANRFIKDQVAQYGEVILVLGVRTGESATRAQVMALHSISGSTLRTHSTLGGALVFAPIEDWAVEDVWSYLLQNAKTPWGTDNNDLAAMYRMADGECPLVVDTTTPSCGSSRFGCWVCTVVTRDKSMEAMIESGQVWMEELLGFRDFLADTQQPDKKSEVRSVRKLDGRILLKDSGDEARLGPYTIEFCKDALERLLRIQSKLPSEANGLELIAEAELFAIRRIWREERHDWEDAVPRIYEASTGKKWVAVSDEHVELAAEIQLLDEVATKYGLPPLLLRRLIDTERRTLGQKRRTGIFEKLSAVIEEDWRDLGQIADDIAALGKGS